MTHDPRFRTGLAEESPRRDMHAAVDGGDRAITVRGGRFVLVDERLIVTTPTEERVNRVGAEEMFAAMRTLVPAGRFCLLLDQRSATRKVLPEARHYLQATAAESIERMAVVVGNAFSRFFASGLVSVANVGITTRAFDDLAVAMAWLREVRPR